MAVTTSYSDESLPSTSFTDETLPTPAVGDVFEVGVFEAGVFELAQEGTWTDEDL